MCEGYPGCEYQVREALAEVLGDKKAEFFFDRVRGVIMGIQNSPAAYMYMDETVSRAFLCRT